MDIELWQILDVGSIWMREFASAMARLHPVVAWWPQMRTFGAFESWVHPETLVQPPLEVLRYPLQRGYVRTPVRQILPFEISLLKRLRAHCTDETSTALICTTPFYTPVAEQWRGPVVYYVTDLTAGYASVDGNQVRALDKRMCRAAQSICVNSRRLKSYMEQDAACPPEKISVVPNATRESNISPAALLSPGPLPSGVPDLRRPVAGVIGNLSGNTDWLLLEPVVHATPWLHWLFVGPTEPIRDKAQQAARTRVMGVARAHFVGSKPYGELQAFARTLDVAVLPYLKTEPTYSGSSTRFYEHLAACRPMLATRGFAELLEKPPLLELVDTPAEMIAGLERLRSLNFHDGHETARWQASRSGTWENRVELLVNALHGQPAGSVLQV
jgi:hypothetical protein